MSHPMKNKLSAGIAAIAIAGGALLGAGDAHAAQSGKDTNHQRYWIKVGNAEMKKSNGITICTNTVGRSMGAATFTTCNAMGKALNKEYKKRPKAKGYWVEYYYKKTFSTVKSGTW